jgi:hypothetical protein
VDTDSAWTQTLQSTGTGVGAKDDTYVIGRMDMDTDLLIQHTMRTSSKHRTVLTSRRW